VPIRRSKISNDNDPHPVRIRMTADIPGTPRRAFPTMLWVGLPTPLTCSTEGLPAHVRPTGVLLETCGRTCGPVGRPPHNKARYFFPDGFFLTNGISSTVTSVPSGGTCVGSGSNNSPSPALALLRTSTSIMAVAKLETQIRSPPSA